MQASLAVFLLFAMIATTIDMTWLIGDFQICEPLTESTPARPWDPDYSETGSVIFVPKHCPTLS